MILSLIAMGQIIYKNDIEENGEADFYNFSVELENKLSWNDSSCTLIKQNLTQYYNYTQYEWINTIRFNRIMCKFINFIGTAGFELGKWGAEWGYNNPQYSAYSLVMAFKWIIIIIVILTAIPVIPVAVALIYVVVVGIIHAYKWLKHKYSQKDTKGKKK